ncbi:hypothetical protein HDU96_004146 [Phlyctochytrium bullatum]|nr:hypothetical protein HDU96_004146 [Phlyctochytrium bullatum]
MTRLFSDSKCTVPAPEVNTTSDCVLLVAPTFVTNFQGLGVFAQSCSGLPEFKLNGTCTNVTGAWFNRRLSPSSAARGSKTHGLVVALAAMLFFAFATGVDAGTLKYDVQVDTVKMPFCLHKINDANGWDYSPQDYISTVASICGERGSECTGRSGPMQAWSPQWGDRGYIEYADFYGWDRRNQLIGAIGASVKYHDDQNNRHDCWDADNSWDVKVLPKSFHAFVYDCDDNGKSCNSAGNLKAGFQAGWVRSNPNWCSFGGSDVAEVSVKFLKLDGIVPSYLSGSLAAVDFFNAVVKMICGFRSRSESLTCVPDCTAFHNRQLNLTDVPYECKGNLKNVTFIDRV